MKKKPQPRRLRMEPLEPRALLAVTAGASFAAEPAPAPAGAVRWEVNTSSDPVSWSTADDIISLREAIARASAGDLITFTAAVARKTIILHGSQLEIYRGITIDASAVGRVCISGDGRSLVFYVNGGSGAVPVSMICLEITGGSGTNGGGIANYGTLTVTDSLIRGCSAGYGAGIYNGGGNLTLSGTTLTENNSGNQGGGLYNSGTLTMTACGIFRNGAYSGAGIYHYSGTADLTGSVMYENSSVYNGGGIYAGSGTVILTNCTVAANEAGEFYSGGGIYSSARNVFLYNSLVIQNTAGASGDIRRSSGSLFGYNTLTAFTGWAGSADCPEYDPALPLFARSLYSDYSLAENSQAINRGNNEYIEGCAYDIEANPRIAGGIVDLGAYEYPLPDPDPTQLETPVLLTGTGGYFVSAGANRHRLTWTAVENASGYEIAYSDGSGTWTSVTTTGTSMLITGLTYGKNVLYRIRALGEGLYSDSEWTGTKTFLVCPMDINGNGDISNVDYVFLASAWLTDEEDDDYLIFCDINADGNIANIDRAFLISNWFLDAEDAEIYPPALASGLPLPQAGF